MCRQIGKMKKDSGFHKFYQVVNKLQLLFHLLSLYWSWQIMSYLWNADIKLTLPTTCAIISKQWNVSIHQTKIEHYQCLISRLCQLSGSLSWFNLQVFRLSHQITEYPFGLLYWWHDASGEESTDTFCAWQKKVGEKLWKYSRFCLACGIPGDGEISGL